MSTTMTILFLASCCEWHPAGKKPSLFCTESQGSAGDTRLGHSLFWNWPKRASERAKDALELRFSGSSDLDGHSFGNLFITASSDITGSFESAVVESACAIGERTGSPATLHNVKLVASMQLPHTLNEVRVEGESKIPEMVGRVRRVWLEPDDVPAYPPAMREINRGYYCGGPGSLYTSLLPNFWSKICLSAMNVSRAIKIYVSNIATPNG